MPVLPRESSQHLLASFKTPLKMTMQLLVPNQRPSRLKEKTSKPETGLMPFKKLREKKTFNAVF